MSASSDHSSVSIIDSLMKLLHLLECPVCFEYISPPVAQCAEGHIVCSTCKNKLTKCPLCDKKFCNIRIRAVDQIAETMVYPCNSTGCPELVSLKQRNHHEKVCTYPKKNVENKPEILKKNILKNIEDNFSISLGRRTSDTESVSPKAGGSSPTEGTKTKKMCYSHLRNLTVSNNCRRTAVKCEFHDVGDSSNTSEEDSIILVNTRKKCQRDKEENSYSSSDDSSEEEGNKLYAEIEETEDEEGEYVHSDFDEEDANSESDIAVCFSDVDYSLGENDSIRSYNSENDSIRSYDGEIDSIRSYDGEIDSLRSYDGEIDSIRSYDGENDSIDLSDCDL